MPDTDTSPERDGISEEPGARVRDFVSPRWPSGATHPRPDVSSFQEVEPALNFRELLHHVNHLLSCFLYLVESCLVFRFCFAALIFIII